MTEPMCAAGTQLAVFWDAGQNGIHALYPDGSAAESATEGGVYFADVNETGLITVLTDKDGYRGSVVVYDTDLTPLFRWDASSVTPVSARTTGKGLLCVNGMSPFARDGQNANAAVLCEVRPSDFGSADPLAGVELQRTWERAAFLADTTIQNLARYRMRSIPAAGALLREEDRGERQMTLLDGAEENTK